MTSDSQTKDLNWVNHNAILDRVPYSDFDNEKPLADIVNVSDKTFLPTLQDHLNLMKDFNVLVSRVLVEHLPHFQNACKSLFYLFKQEESSVKLEVKN